MYESNIVLLKLWKIKKWRLWVKIYIWQYCDFGRQIYYCLEHTQSSAKDFIHYPIVLNILLITDLRFLVIWSSSHLVFVGLSGILQNWKQSTKIPFSCTLFRPTKLSVCKNLKNSLSIGWKVKITIECFINDFNFIIATIGLFDSPPCHWTN